MMTKFYSMSKYFSSFRAGWKECVDEKSLDLTGNVDKLEKLIQFSNDLAKVDRDSKKIDLPRPIEYYRVLYIYIKYCKLYCV